MILDDFPELRQLDRTKKAQLVSELMDDLLEREVELPPDLLAAIEERIAYNEAHPNDVLTTEQFTARFAQFKKRLAARKSHA